MRALILTQVVIAALPAAAQTPVGRHVVQGVVYDSVEARPLAGASVQLAVRDGTGVPLAVTTDVTGRYRIAEVPPGQYVLGFYHDALTALGLDAPVQTLEVGRDSLVTADLAIPSSAVVRALRCGTESARPDRGMLVGFVRGAESRAAVSGAAVRLQWGAIALDADSLRTVTEQSTASIESDGSFLACGLPLDVSLDLQVTAPGRHAIIGPVATVPLNGIGRLDLVLSDSAAAHGSAVVRGRVTRTSGKAVATGRVVLEALKRDVPVKDGAFVMGDLPPGSWIIEARVIGTEPHAMLVTATDGAFTEAAITAGDQVQRLDAVTVVGKMDRNTRVLEEVLRRRNHGSGTFFMPGSWTLRMAAHVSDVMKNARGFRYKSPTDIGGRAFTGIACGKPAVYVDDGFFPGGFELLDLNVTIDQVLAIETYPDASLAPAQYRYGFGGNPGAPTLRPCAVVVIWTKRKF